MTDREQLAARIEAATGPDRELDAEIAKAVGHPHGQKSGWCNGDNGDYFVIDECAYPYTASIDAAMMLVPEGCEWLRKDQFTMTVYKAPADGAWSTHVDAVGATPALALAAAAIRAGGV